MARKVRDKALDTRAERGKLKARGNPYWRALDPGAHLGYRRIAGKAGAWTLRTYVKGRPENPYDVEVIGIADDMSDANGADVLNFYQAQERARARRDERSRSAAGAAGPLTVAKAMEHYLVFLEDKRKSAVDAGYRYEAFIKEPLGRIEVAALKAQQIRNWHSDLVKLAPRLRTRKGESNSIARSARTRTPNVAGRHPQIAP